MKITNFLIIALTIIIICCLGFVLLLRLEHHFEAEPVVYEYVAVAEIDRMEPSQPSCMNDIPMEAIEEPVVVEPEVVEEVIDVVRTDVTYYDIPLDDEPPPPLFPCGHVLLLPEKGLPSLHRLLQGREARR